VVRSPMHGVHMVSSACALRDVGLPLDPAKNKALGSLAWRPHTNDEVNEMGDEEMDALKRVLHWRGSSADDDVATAMSVAADVGSYAVDSPALASAHYAKMGHADARVSDYITLGAVIDA